MAASTQGRLNTDSEPNERLRSSGQELLGYTSMIEQVVVAEQMQRQRADGNINEQRMRQSDFLVQISGKSAVTPEPDQNGR